MATTLVEGLVVGRWTCRWPRLHRRRAGGASQAGAVQLVDAVARGIHSLANDSALETSGPWRSSWRSSSPSTREAQRKRRRSSHYDRIRQLGGKSKWEIRGGRGALRQRAPGRGRSRTGTIRWTARRPRRRSTASPRAAPRRCCTDSRIDSTPALRVASQQQLVRADPPPALPFSRSGRKRRRSRPGSCSKDQPRVADRPASPSAPRSPTPHAWRATSW